MKTYTSFSFLSFSRRFRFAGLMLLVLASARFAICGPIHDAARKGDVKKVQTLLQSDPKLIADKDSRGDTPLHSAALHGELAVARVLIDAGADVNAKNNYGAFTPEELWKVISSSNHQDPVVLLAVHGIDAKDMLNGYTPLDLAMFAARHKELVQLLVSKGANVNAMAASGATPLFWAVFRDQKDDAAFLLDHGANVNATDAYGDSILGLALHLQYGSLIQLLVDKGADVNAMDQSQHRPLTFALQMDDHRWAELLKQHGAHE
jgi:ankyrin repeat protein